MFASSVLMLAGAAIGGAGGCGVFGRSLPALASRPARLIWILMGGTLAVLSTTLVKGIAGGAT